ncbi:hypothetical protein KC686_03850, partial [Candidatus Woesebacteria bacterium]|nr:hypothetical protein [Candidatus Woesebacteria bacterium]
QKKKVEEPVNVIPVSERPYLQIIPETDGRNITIQVISLKKPADSVDFELEYQAGELLQGVFGTMSLTSLPASDTQLMGSCSAGGKCSYHENVQGGTLLTRYTGAENYALKSDWKYIDNTAGEKEISSKDAKFQLSSDDISTNRYLVIFNDAGYPDGLEGTLNSEIYSLTSSSPLKGSAELTIRAHEDGSTAIMGYDGESWKRFEGSVDGKAITAQVDLMELYVAVR